MKYYTLEEIKDEMVGKKGTAVRDRYDMAVKADQDILELMQVLKKIRIAKGVSQPQLGKLIGVKASQICRWENEGGLHLHSFIRMCKALDVKINFYRSEDKLH